MKYAATETSRPLAVGAVIVCAGKGERCGLPYNKVLHRIGTKTTLEYVLDAFFDAHIHNITVVTSEQDKALISELVVCYDGVRIVTGGSTRKESVCNGLIATPCDIVVIHDGARPYVSPDLITRCIDSATTTGSGIAAVKCVNTIKRINEVGKVTSLQRSQLFETQTPQTFRYKDILDAYMRLDGEFTDDAEVYEKAGYNPVLVDGDYSNIKITTPRDLLPAAPIGCRIGVGFDVHRLEKGRKLILGGVKIDYPLGLVGHSDADVLVHAIMDALLSAADYPDIGVLFPDTDDGYLGANSIELLKRVVAMVEARNLSVAGISAVVAAQRPKLAPHIKNIRETLSSAIGIEDSRLNVSATTTEGLGIIGAGEAIAADAVCMLSETGKK